MKALLVACITIAAIVTLSACNSKGKQPKQDDTSLVLKSLLDSAFYKPKLVKEISLKDTAIIQYNSVLVNHLPDDLLYKLLTEDEMCRLMKASKLSHLQFFSLGDFTKTSNGYDTSFGTHCMSRGASGPVDTICERSKYCNVVLHMEVVKKAGVLQCNRSFIFTY